MERSVKGFTLVELLVVIGIISTADFYVIARPEQGAPRRIEYQMPQQS
ncbi:MAG TPA: prepilin-type N-terminal cleavage/methylation domain-containing protein [Tepidisphaeraceae bacterium]|nr:prepilin-type N-terminal cleavage/methylation domain-containing protein [Tepidisphaeraceae bacterium]